MHIFWRSSPQWATASSFKMFLDRTPRRTKVGRTSLDELSVCRTDLYLTNTQHSQQTHIHVSGRFRTPSRSKLAAADPRLRPSGHHDQRQIHISVKGVTFPKSPPPQHVHMTHHRREHRPSVSRSPSCSSRVNDERLRCLN